MFAQVAATTTTTTTKSQDDKDGRQVAAGGAAYQVASGNSARVQRRPPPPPTTRSSAGRSVSGQRRAAGLGASKSASTLSVGPKPIVADFCASSSSSAAAAASCAAHKQLVGGKAARQFDERPTGGGDETRQLDGEPPNGLASVCGQLLTLVSALLLLIYLVDLAQRKMTNLLTKILGGGGGASAERRRSSLAASQQQVGGQQTATLAGARRQDDADGSLAGAQSRCASTLCLPRNSTAPSQLGSSSQAAPNSAGSRRTSRSSLHSLLGALTGGAGFNNNGN